ncbi:MAG: M20 family metallo-hydrolase [Crenarchaeota archaeon]|nr:M20 family metallo-hydrolase [Thermoproteota archaeon]
MAWRLPEDARRELEGYVLSLYRAFIPVKAIPPDMGGRGELARARVLEEEMRRLGLDVKRVDAEDPRAEGGVRPNLLAIMPGSDSGRTLWIVAHLDTVPEGDPSLWRVPPFQVTVEGDLVYGRGVEDDGQGIVLALGLVWLLRRLGEEPRVNIGVALVADEEAGSRYGLLHLLEKRVFGSPEASWFLVPDAGSPDGSKVIVAEKHILWMKVTVEGRQAHASMPHTGLNAHRLGMMFNLELDATLHSMFARRDTLFEPPFSTFEPTRKEENVPNINTIPGRDVVYWDNRILPSYTVDEVETVFHAVAYRFSSAYAARVTVETVMRDEAGEPTSPDHPLVKSLAEALRETRGVEAKPVGIGGGTVARYLRRRGYPAAVWMTCDETAHQPNEHTRLSYVTADIETLYYMVTRLL